MKDRCPSCFKITKDTAASFAGFGAPEPTASQLVRATCPHCDEHRYITSILDFWWCSCQVCQCPELVISTQNA